MSARGFEVVADGEHPTAELPAVEPDPPPGSLLADLRRRAAKQREDRTLDLEVGGAFGDRLVLRYGLLPVDELERYAALVGKLSEISVALDVVVRVCKGVYGRRDDGTLEQLTDADGKPLGLDNRLAEVLAVGIADVPELTPREVVSALFGNNALALAAHVEQLVAWMQDPEAMPGESFPART